MFVDMFKDLFIKVDKEANLFSSTQECFPQYMVSHAGSFISPHIS